MKTTSLFFQSYYFENLQLKRGLKAKSMGYLKLGQLHKTRYLIGIDSILLDPSVPEIFYFKHNVGASNML